MKFNASIEERLFKLLFFGIGFVFVTALTYQICQGIAMGILEWYLIFCPGVFLLGLLSAKYQSAPGELTPEGVYVRHFFRCRFYAWSEIKQAGILERRGKNNYHEIILVKPGGSPRKPGDETSLFLLRNTFRLIYISHDFPEEAYVRKFYGELDFNRYGL